MPNFCTQCGNPIGVLQPASDAMREALKWQLGAPCKPWSSEWFIAETTYGDRVVLRELPEGYTYDFKTADETYIKKDKIKRWLQFPDSQFVTADSAPVPSPDGAAGELPLAVRLRDAEGPPLPQMAAQRRVQLANAAAAPPPPDDVRSALADRLSKLSVCLDYRTPHPHTRFVAGLAMSEDDRDLIVAALRLASVSVPATTMRDALVKARPYVEIVYTESPHAYDKAVLEQIDDALRTSAPAVGVTREAMTAAVRHEIERCTEGLLYIPRPLDERIVDAIRSLEFKATT